jgi:hypothetical protein
MKRRPYWEPNTFPAVEEFWWLLWYLNHINQVYTLTHFLNIQFNRIRPSTSRSPKWFKKFGFVDRNTCIFQFGHTNSIGKLYNCVGPRYRSVCPCCLLFLRGTTQRTCQEVGLIVDIFITEIWKSDWCTILREGPERVVLCLRTLLPKLS